MTYDPINPTPPDLPAASHGLDARIRNLESCLRVFAALILIFLGFQVFQAVHSIPRFEMLFGDMLGSRDKIPILTQKIIALNRAIARGMGGMVIVFLLTVGGVITAAFLPKKGALFGVLGCGIVLGVIKMILHIGLALPLQKIIQGIGY